jgi:putative ATP-dependent endonuclease of OLD family
MKFIKKIKLQNFKRFEFFEVGFADDLNLLIGDNESGKSSILTAIDILLSGSRNKVEAYGLEYLFNSAAIERFLKSDRKYAGLPRMAIELYLNELNNEETNGKINSDKVTSDGLKILCEPNDEFAPTINEILEQSDCIFPFEYYSIDFKTFAGRPYSGYKKYLKHILIDTSQVGSDYAMKEYVKDIYSSSLTGSLERYQHKHHYRYHKDNFRKTVFKEMNERLEGYSFSIKTNSKSNLEADLTILEGDITIENKGKGRQCIVKTELALRTLNELEIVLMEEPENHLSHGNMKKLVQKISSSKDKQIFIATHSNLISTRLDLRKSILLNSTSTVPLKLESLSEDTAKFFVKAPDNNMLEFILAKKVILVEGDAEYILVESLFKTATNQAINDCDIHVISVDGTSFKRYLEIAKILSIRTAVIRDNDNNYQLNCVDNYSDYIAENIKIFADGDKDRHTFEVCLYEDNKQACEELFSAGRKTLSVQQYMLKNKADVAYRLLTHCGATLVAPQYIKDAFQWIKE